MKAIEERKNKKKYDGLFKQEGLKEFEEEVTGILALKIGNETTPPIEVRSLIIDTLIDAYIEQTGQVPKGNQVQRLANWVLLEKLTDSHPDKVTIEEYPIMTNRQLRKRYMREIPSEIISITETFDNQEKPAKKNIHKI